MTLYINIGDDSLRAAVPYESAPGPKSKNAASKTVTPADKRCLSQPTVSTPLLILQAIRAGHADNAQMGLAENDSDQKGWQMLLAVIFDFLPKKILRSLFATTSTLPSSVSN